MASIQNDLRLFGLDLRHLGLHCGRAWQVLQATPVLSWLNPEPLVRLFHTDGKNSIWQMASQPVVQAGASQASVRFAAVELPQDMCLQREINLPELKPDQVRAAVALEVQSASPFAPQDLAWGYREAVGENGQLRVVVVMASRKHIQSHLQAVASMPSDLVPEIWVLTSPAKCPVVLDGFGESLRFKYTVIRRNLGYVLFLMVLLLLVLLILTPTAQTLLRTADAVVQHEKLVNSSAAVVRQREAFLQSTEQVKYLSDELNKRIDPLRLLETLTQVLPDDTAVQNLKLQGRKVTFSGLTANASVLMELLGKQSGLTDLRAPSPATRLPGAQQRENFVIEFMLDPALFGVAQLAPKPANVAASEPLALATPASAESMPSGSASASSAASPAPVQPPASKPSATFGGGGTFGGGAFGGSPTAKPAAPAGAIGSSSSSGAKP
jgi:general secretion pathway protein L